MFKKMGVLEWGLAITMGVVILSCAAWGIALVLNLAGLDGPATVAVAVGLLLDVVAVMMFLLLPLACTLIEGSLGLFQDKVIPAAGVVRQWLSDWKLYIFLEGRYARRLVYRPWPLSRH